MAEQFKHLKNPNPRYNWRDGELAFYTSPVTGLITCGRISLYVPRSDMQVRINEHTVLKDRLFDSLDSIQVAMRAVREQNSETNTPAKKPSPIDIANNPVRIHKPDGHHTWGIEYNYTSDRLDTPAEGFVKACRQKLLTSGSGWFWQSGSNSPSTGYQFFEYMGPEPYETAKSAAHDIAAIIHTYVVDIDN